MLHDLRLEIERRDRIIREQAKIIKRQTTRIEKLEANDQEQAATVQKQAATILELEAKVERLLKLLEGKAEAKSAKKPIFTENYSLERNKKDKPTKKEPTKTAGRKTTKSKLDQVTKKTNIYPENVSHAKCEFHRSQFVWKIIEGQAIYVQYDIYDLPASKNLPLPLGVRTSRSEFCIEIILILAFLHYWIGISLDNTREVINFFTGLKLSKSQTESLLKQLATDWEEQYDTIAELLALQMVIYIDETGWRVGKKHCYTWVFSTSMHVLFRCGVSRKKDEATAILGEDFAGIGVTDDYAAYKTMFTQHQLCWAHLIRKAIKLMLQNPDEIEYEEFLDQLCLLYHDAKD